MILPDGRRVNITVENDPQGVPFRFATVIYDRTNEVIGWDFAYSLAELRRILKGYETPALLKQQA